VSTTDDVRDVTLRLIDLLESNGVPYVVMGGIAVSIWAIPRATFDVDLTLAVDDEGLAGFFRLAKDSGFEVDAPFETGFKDVLAGMEKVRLEWWTAASRRVEVDVFLVTTSYQEAAFGRRVRARIANRHAWVLSPADLILHKLVARRPKDLADVQNILSIQGLSDESYLREWGRRLRVEGELARALARAGLSGDPADE
jgi:hypothetical protein